MNKYKQISKQANMEIDIYKTYVPDYKTKKIIENSPYKDVTKEWLDKATPNVGNITIDDYFMTDDGIKHPIKGQEKIAVVNKESEEYRMSEVLKRLFGGDIHLVPRIEQEKGYKGVVKVSTPDFRWNGEKWDLKIP